MDELSVLDQKYGAGKGPSSNHMFTPIYNDLLKDHKDDFETILEIGKKPGLYMWRDYFPKSTIYGFLDEEENFEEDRIIGLKVNQMKPLEIKRLDKTFDLIIDDGCHQPIPQLISFLSLWEKLKPNGLYIVEDVFPGNAQGIAAFSDCFDDCKVHHIHALTDCFVCFQKTLEPC